MADGNEVLSVDQLKSMASAASVTSYGLVKVMTDEQLDAYLGANVPEDGTVTIEKHNHISSYINTFKVTGKCVDGKVSITGEVELYNYIDAEYIAIVSEPYRPLNKVTGTCRVFTYDYRWIDTSITIDTDGLVEVTGGYQWDAIDNINISYSLKQEVEEPDGIYVVTVQQAVRYLGNISGGGSGGGSDSGGVVLYEGTAGPSGDGTYGAYGITGNMSSLNDYSSYVATLSDGTYLTFNEIASSGTDYIGMYDTTTGNYALTVIYEASFDSYAFGIVYVPTHQSMTVYKFIGYK